MLLCFPAAAPHRSKCWVATRCQRVWRWKKKCFPALKKFANWKKLLTAGFSWAILEQEIRKKPLVCLAFVSCRVCPASRNIEITAACHERKNYFRAQRVFDWKRMFTAESSWEILEQEIRKNFNILSCRSWPLRSAARTVELRHVVKLGNERKPSFSRLKSLRIGRKCSPLDLLGQFWNRIFERSYFALSRVEWLPREKKNVFAPKRVCELEENAHRWIFLGNSGSNWAPLSAFVQLCSVEE